MRTVCSAHLFSVSGKYIQHFNVEAFLCSRVGWIRSQYAVSGHNRPANETPYKLRYAGGPMMALWIANHEDRFSHDDDRIASLPFRR